MRKFNSNNNITKIQHLLVRKFLTQQEYNKLIRLYGISYKYQGENPFYEDYNLALVYFNGAEFYIFIEK